MRVTVKIQKWGNSLAVRIPIDIAKQINLKQDQEVELKVTDNGIELNLKKQKPTLEELTAQITDANQHAKVNWGNLKAENYGKLYITLLHIVAVLYLVF